MTTMSSEAAWWEPVVDRGLLPDPVMRAVVEARITARIAVETRASVEERSERRRAFLEARSTGPISRHVEDANRQHYELLVSHYLFRPT